MWRLELHRSWSASFRTPEPVLSENSIEPKSGRIAMIEVEQTTEPFASADGATAVISGRHERRVEESIADALVVAFQICSG